MKIRIAPLSANAAGTTDRRRFIPLKSALPALGVDVEFYQPGESFDVLIVGHRAYGHWLKIAEEAHARGAKVLFDCTDAILDDSPSPLDLDRPPGWRSLIPASIKEAINGWLGRSESRRMAIRFFKACDGIVTGSAGQSEPYRKISPEKPIAALVDPVDFTEYKPPKVHAPNDPPIVVWEGTANNIPYLQVCAKPLKNLIDAGVIRLRIVADRRRKFPWRQMTDNEEILRSFGLDRFEFIDWKLDSFSEKLAEGDIGIAPLFTNVHHASIKPANKILGFAALGLPAIASPVPAYRQTLEEGQFGLLAGSDEEWDAALRRLAENPALRRELAARGKAYIEKNHTIAAYGRRYLDFIQSLK